MKNIDAADLLSVIQNGGKVFGAANKAEIQVDMMTETLKEVLSGMRETLAKLVEEVNKPVPKDPNLEVLVRELITSTEKSTALYVTLISAFTKAVDEFKREESALRPKYSFDVERDSRGLMKTVIATPIETTKH